MFWKVSQSVNQLNARISRDAGALVYIYIYIFTMFGNFPLKVASDRNVLPYKHFHWLHSVSSATQSQGATVKFSCVKELQCCGYNVAMLQCFDVTIMLLQCCSITVAMHCFSC